MRWHGIAVALGAAALLMGCAHPVVITPDFDQLGRGSVQPIDKTVAYYIAPADRERKVLTPTAMGDKLAYYPYRELEPALQKVLNNQFRAVKRLSSPNEALQSNEIAFVFQPEITTDSSSTSLLFWPPEKFTVNLLCRATDSRGNPVWETRISFTGTATSDEFTKEFSLAAKRASAQVFKELQQQMNAAPELRR